MKIYRVAVVRVFEEGERSGDFIKPFTSEVKSKKFHREINKDENFEATMLDPLDFPISKPGILAAFEAGLGGWRWMGDEGE